MPWSRFWLLLMAAFLLFSAGGFYSDLISGGTQPYAIVFIVAAYTGLNACLWIIVLSRFPAVTLVGVIALQFFSGSIIKAITVWMKAHFALHPVPSATGTYFAATSMYWASILSYVFFLSYIVGEGKRSLRIQSELELAHEIQKTLVPPIHLRTPRFEIYGISHPSEKVGGDLVDAVSLPGGETIAYLADIAGHGLTASIFMGRVKTAVRTALLDAGACEANTILPLLLDRLNTVLPQVKEPQMYATFTGFRFGSDGSIFCAVAASPPFLHWQAHAQTIAYSQDPQLPIGLLPVPAFEGYAMKALPGDLLVVATDGILEVADRSADEFGIDRLMDLIAKNSSDPLPDLADKILSAARAFGRQFDDQTILVVRCL